MKKLLYVNLQTGERKGEIKSDIFSKLFELNIKPFLFVFFYNHKDHIARIYLNFQLLSLYLNPFFTLATFRWPCLTATGFLTSALTSGRAATPACSSAGFAAGKDQTFDSLRRRRLTMCPARMFFIDKRNMIHRRTYDSKLDEMVQEFWNFS